MITRHSTACPDPEVHRRAGTHQEVQAGTRRRPACRGIESWGEDHPARPGAGRGGRLGDRRAGGTVGLRGALVSRWGLGGRGAWGAFRGLLVLELLDVVLVCLRAIEKRFLVGLTWDHALREGGCAGGHAGEGRRDT